MIYQKDKEGNVVNVFDSVQEATDKTGVFSTNIYKVLRGKRTTAGGYFWMHDLNTEDTSKTNSSETWEESGETASKFFTFKGQVKSLEDALEHCNADLTKWEVKAWSHTYWAGNSRVKIDFNKINKDDEDIYYDLINTVREYSPKEIITVEGNSKEAVVLFSDIHLGADVRNLARTPGYNIGILIDYLKDMSEQINSYNYSKVNLCFLGDFFESISGLNHEDTFKSMDKTYSGSNAMIVAHIVLTDFIKSIKNITSLNIITGNHDRLSPKSTSENTGEAGKMVAYLLRITFPNIAIDCNDLIISKNIDGINYILTHGDKRISQRDITKTILDYSDSTAYNLHCQGHLHELRDKRYYKQTTQRFLDYTFVSVDEMNYRSITVPSIFTGNYYSESNGWGANAGFIISTNNGKGKPNTNYITL